MNRLPSEVRIVHPGDSFAPELYVEPGVEAKQIDNQLHDLMMSWTAEQVADAYAENQPGVSKAVLLELLKRKPNHMHFAGMDLIHVVNNKTHQTELLLLETNAISARQDAMPTSSRVYERQLGLSFFSREKEWALGKDEGGLAFIYGDNVLSTPSYPHFMAQLSGESVYFVPMSSLYDREAILSGRAVEGDEQLVKFVDGIMYIKYQGAWLPIRACYWKQTAKPWAYAPAQTKTFIYPKPISVIAGGKNKVLGQKACEAFNEKYSSFGIEIRTPKTITGVKKDDIRSCLAKHFPSGRAMIKTPYESQSRGVYVIRSEEDIVDFLAAYKLKYELFTVQELIGAEQEDDSRDRYSFVGFEDENGDKSSYSLRCIICDSPDEGGFKLLCLCGARAPIPFRTSSKSNNGVHNNGVARDTYVTNLGRNHAFVQKERAIHADSESLRRMGLEFKHIVDAYVTSIFTLHAIDEMCSRLMKQSKDGSLQLDFDTLRELNPDPPFIAEVLKGQELNLPLQNGFHHAACNNNGYH